MVEYKLISDDCNNLFNMELNNALKVGFKREGNIVITPLDMRRTSIDKVMYSQLMVKETNRG